MKIVAVLASPIRCFPDMVAFPSRICAIPMGITTHACVQDALMMHCTRTQRHTACTVQSSAG